MTGIPLIIPKKFLAEELAEKAEAE